MSQVNIIRFAETLAGIYDNFAQSQANPKDFARINIVFRPLPRDIFNGPGFYSEQYYDHSPGIPIAKASIALRLKTRHM